MSNERHRGETFSTGPGAYSDDFGGTATMTEGRVEVIYGVYAHSLPLAGMTVSQARSDWKSG